MQVYKNVSKKLIYTFTLHVYKTVHWSSERIQCSTSVKYAVKTLYNHAVLPFFLPNGLREMIHLLHTLLNNNRLTCFLPSLHFSSSMVLGQSKKCIHSSSPPDLRQVEVAVIQNIPRLCPLLLHVFCLRQNSISHKYFNTSSVFIFYKPSCNVPKW